MRSFEFGHCVVSFDEPSKSVFLRTTYSTRPEEAWRSRNRGRFYNALRKVERAHAENRVEPEWEDRGKPYPEVTTHEMLGMLDDIVGMSQTR